MNYNETKDLYLAIWVCAMVFKHLPAWEGGFQYDKKYTSDSHYQQHTIMENGSRTAMTHLLGCTCFYKLTKMDQH